jgi:hypothetical protein
MIFTSNQFEEKFIAELKVGDVFRFTEFGDDRQVISIQPSWQANSSDALIEYDYAGGTQFANAFLLLAQDHILFVFEGMKEK